MPRWQRNLHALKGGAAGPEGREREAAPYTRAPYVVAAQKKSLTGTPTRSPKPVAASRRA
jgi:hypothetical protein